MSSLQVQSFIYCRLLQRTDFNNSIGYYKLARPFDGFL